MSGWQVGDLALCVRSGRGHKLIVRVGDDLFLENGGRTLRVHAGRLYRVTHVRNLIGPNLDLALGFEESIGPWLASRFRKIKPDTEGANEDDAAWLKDLLTKKVKA